MNTVNGRKRNHGGDNDDDDDGIPTMQNDETYGVVMLSMKMRKNLHLQ